MYILAKDGISISAHAVHNNFCQDCSCTQFSELLASNSRFRNKVAPLPSYELLHGSLTLATMKLKGGGGHFLHIEGVDVFCNDPFNTVKNHDSSNNFP
jgi:hypothetical protein